MRELQKRVDLFIQEAWGIRRRAVRAQMQRCVREVQLNGRTVVYGFVCPRWEDTVTILQSLALPVRLLLKRASWVDVTAGDIARLEERVQRDVVLRLRLLDVCQARDGECARGQALLTQWLQHAPSPRKAVATGQSQGKVELLFLSCAVEEEEERRYLFALMHLYLLVAACTDTFTPLLVPPMPCEPEACAAEVLDALASLWLCDPAQALSRISSMVQQPVTSLSALAALLPPCSCTTLAAFVQQAGAVGAAEPPSPPEPRQPPERLQADESEMWIRMTEQSSLFPPMYLGPQGEWSFKLMDE